jgi:hypothetical protein
MSNSNGLSVVEDQCTFAADRRSGKIVVTSTNENFGGAIEDLSQKPARDLALAYAATNGVSDARINGNVIGPYAVNVDGVPLENVPATMPQLAEIPPAHPKMQPASYRLDVPVCTKLV